MKHQIEVVNNIAIQPNFEILPARDAFAYADAWLWKSYLNDNAPVFVGEAAPGELPSQSLRTPTWTRAPIRGGLKPSHR
jgi:hypothetical protein